MRKSNSELITSHRKNSLFSLLIIEDDKELQEYYQFLFQVTNWNIIKLIGNGLVAIKYYQELFPKPSVVVLDIDLPGCSGFQVAEQILKNHPPQKIVFVSGKINDYSIPSDLSHIPSLSKPFRIDELLGTLENLIALT